MAWEYVGYVFSAIAALIVLGLLVMLVLSSKDIARYLNMRRM